MEGCVYFIQSGEQGPVKIGWARDPVKRRRELQTGNPLALHLLALLPGTRSDEAGWHTSFQEHRLRGEWFQPCQCIFNRISCVPRWGHPLEFKGECPGPPSKDIPIFQGALPAPPGWGGCISIHA